MYKAYKLDSGMWTVLEPNGCYYAMTGNEDYAKRIADALNLHSKLAPNSLLGDLKKLMAKYEVK